MRRSTEASALLYAIATVRPGTEPAALEAAIVEHVAAAAARVFAGGAAAALAQSAAVDPLCGAADARAPGRPDFRADDLFRRSLAGDSASSSGTGL